MGTHPRKKKKKSCIRVIGIFDEKETQAREALREASRKTAPVESITIQHSAGGKVSISRVSRDVEVNCDPPPPPIPSTSTADQHPTHDVPMDDDIRRTMPPEPPEPPDSAEDEEMRRNYNQKARAWLPHAQDYLDELIRHEGRMGFEDGQCVKCRKPDTVGAYRCTSCCSAGLLCSACIVEVHSSLPFHRIQKWNGSFFEKKTLADLGLRVCIGHGEGTCPLPCPSPKLFCVGHINGYHYINLDFCACSTQSIFIRRNILLLRAGLFPATFDTPQTAFTFEVLDHFHQLNLQAKINVYDFVQTLQRLTDNTGISEIHRYNEFSLVVRLWRHLILTKRAGRGHDPSGLAGTKEGSCAIACLACPDPLLNLPEGWESLPEVLRWLFLLFLSADANFKLRLKERGIDLFQLGSGWAYSVESDRYETTMDQYGEQKESNDCQSQHTAIIKANSRNTKGYKASGVACIVCGRHTFVRPCSVGDLQKGERYCNIDYLFLSTLMGAGVFAIMLTYDIACQWIKNFRTRVANFPPDMRSSVERVSLRTAIPKGHIEAHGQSCHSKHSLNTQPHVGRTYGEGVEQQWSHINSVATSTREMGPGARKEVLDDHWNWWNWRKSVSFGSHFTKKLSESVAMHKKQRGIFDDFSKTFPRSVVRNWEGMVNAWLADQNNADPYAEPVVETTMNDIRLQLAKEEAAEMVPVTVHDSSPSAFLSAGLVLEEQQRTLRIQTSSSGSRTSGQLADLQEAKNTLRNRIIQWQLTQDAYMPCVAALRHPPSDPSDPAPPVSPESIPLFLPSSVSHDYPQSQRLRLMERRLRFAQCDDALADIRRLRRVLKNVTFFKAKNISGTGGKANTRSRTLYARFQARISKAVARYRSSRAALEGLDPGGDWSSRFQLLADDDVRGPGGEEGDSFGHYVESWIWLVNNEAGSQESPEAEKYGDSVRVEWAKSKARAMRWGEECHLLVEEMRRVLCALEKKALMWDRRGAARPVDSSLLREGLSAYAARQATILRSLAQSFASVWVPLLLKHKSQLSSTIVGYVAGRYTEDIIDEIVTRYPVPPPPSSVDVTDQPETPKATPTPNTEQGEEVEDEDLYEDDFDF